MKKLYWFSLLSVVLVIIFVATLATGLVAQGAVSCSSAVFCTTAQFGETSQFTPFTLYNNMWGATSSDSQSMAANSFSQWTIIGNYPETSGVRSYPNASLDLVSSKTVGTLGSCTSSFNVGLPGSGSWEAAYDLWVPTEVMVWMDKNGAVQPIATSYDSSGNAVPSASNVSAGGQTWNVYKGGSNVISFVRQTNTTSGTVDILALLNWAVSQGWIPSSGAVGKMQFGFEITTASNLEFDLNSYSMNCGGMGGGTTGPTNTPLPPTKTFTPGPTATKTNTPVPTTPSGPTQTPPPGGNGLNVLIDKGSGTDTNQETAFNFEVKNTGSSAVSNISTRIYFTADGSNAGSGYTMEKYYDQSGVATISAPTLASGSTYYFTINFGTASLGAGAQWEFQTALHLSSWGTTYDGSNDWYHTGYAVGALPASYTLTNNIPAYVSGSLVWGQAPGGSPAPTATKPAATNTFVPPTATKPAATSTTGPSSTPVPPTKTNTPGPTATKPPATNTPVATSSGSDPCASPTVITGGGTFSVTTATTCFKYVNTSFVNGGMISVMKDSTSATDTLKWYGGMDQNVTACANQSATVSGNGGQLNNFTIAKDANSQMFLIVTGSASNSITISIQNWQNGSGCSVKPTVHP